MDQVLLFFCARYFGHNMFFVSLFWCQNKCIRGHHMSGNGLDGFQKTCFLEAKKHPVEDKFSLLRWFLKEDCSQEAKFLEKQCICIYVAITQQQAE